LANPSAIGATKELLVSQSTLGHLLARSTRQVGNKVPVPLDLDVSTIISLLFLFVQTSKGASSSINAPITAELARMLERQIRDSRAIDMEALCITPGQRVWQLRVDIHVLSDDGNISDAASLAAISALAHFKRPEVTVLRNGKGVKIHSFSEAVPQPLSLHHIPVAVTLGLFNDPEARLKSMDFIAASTSAVMGGSSSSSAASGSGAGGEEEEGSGSNVASAASSSSSSSSGLAGTSDFAVLDPTLLEEAVYDGRITFVMNAHRELCGIHKLGGAPLHPQALSAAVKIAGQRAQELVLMVKQAVAAAEKESAARDAASLKAAVGESAEPVLKVASSK
jgi:exosome complex RNA-binding protein Rrp42 (RNase PH superfamily)